MPYPKVVLKKGKERSLLNFHPWLFSGAIQRTEGTPAEGDIVDVVSTDQRFLASGHFHEGSIKVRIFSFEPHEYKYEFWKKKLQDAHRLRTQLNLVSDAATNAYRLVHAEGDGLPGLIIDMYDSTAILQAHTRGMFAVRHDICRALREIYGDTLKAVYDKSSESLGRQGVEQAANEFLFGEGEAIHIRENGLTFYVDVAAGQKTGFFLDQRDNRKLLAHYAKGKNVLNAFAYSGGFSVYALSGEARLVHSVDSSKKAGEWAEKNVSLNFKNANHAFYTEDVFGFLKRETEKYDVMVLDPPAFAKHLSAVSQATVGYRNLNYEAFRRIAPGGILFTFSCSQVIDKMLFRKIVFTAAAQARRNVRILHQLTQPPDHPVSLYHPEGEYLKGLVLHVE